MLLVQDYSDARFPATARIVDLLRCSITFDNCSEMKDAINKFVDRYKNGSENNTTCIRKILRIKNGFKATKRWKKTDDYGYCDVKMNVVISDGLRRTIIGEIQFIIGFQLRAKQMGHACYSFLRRRDFVENVKTLMKEWKHDNNNEILFKKRMNQIILRKNLNEFQNELMLNDDKIVPKLLNFVKIKIKNKNNNVGYVPLLYSLCTRDWMKASKLLFSNIIHFDDCYNLDKKFVWKYLNYPNTMSKNCFYGLKLSNLSNNKHDSRHSFISAFLKSRQFDAIKVKYENLFFT